MDRATLVKRLHAVLEPSLRKSYDAQTAPYTLGRKASTMIAQGMKDAAGVRPPPLREPLESTEGEGEEEDGEAAGAQPPKPKANT